MAFLSAGMVFVAYEVYCAWAYRVVRSIPFTRELYDLYCHLVANSGCSGLPSTWISFKAYPILFFASLAVAIAVIVVLGILLSFLFRSWQNQRRNLDRRDSRPPMDSAIRESIDR